MNTAVKPSFLFSHYIIISIEKLANIKAKSFSQLRLNVDRWLLFGL